MAEVVDAHVEIVDGPDARKIHQAERRLASIDGEMRSLKQSDLILLKERADGTAKLGRDLLVGNGSAARSRNWQSTAKDQGQPNAMTDDLFDGRSLPVLRPAEGLRRQRDSLVRRGLELVTTSTERLAEARRELVLARHYLDMAEARVEEPGCVAHVLGAFTRCFSAWPKGDGHSPPGRRGRGASRLCQQPVATSAIEFRCSPWATG